MILVKAPVMQGLLLNFACATIATVFGTKIHIFWKINFSLNRLEIPTMPHI